MVGSLEELGKKSFVRMVRQQQQQQIHQQHLEAAVASPPALNSKSQEGSPHSPTPSSGGPVSQSTTGAQHSSKLVRK